MANIPVERSAGTPWWLWLLGLLLLGLLIWFLAGLLGDDDDADVYVADDAVEDVDVAGTIEPVATGMDLSTLYVTRVTGDRTFFVAPTADSADETLVILDQNMSPDAPGIEGQVDINAGQRVDLSDGSYEAAGDADMMNMGIPDDDLNAMTAETMVIRIDGGDVEIYDAELENVEVDE